MLELILASQSPRRRELLSHHGFQFRVFPVKVSEIIDENLNPAGNASRLSSIKAEAALAQHNMLKQKGFLVLSADTLVALDGRIFGKPENRIEAADFLRNLSGKTHSVITGMTLIETGTPNSWTGESETKVEFHSLSDQAIAEYVATGEADDKAGAYGIQGAAQKFVSSYSGSWSNVVGLPIELLMRVLKDHGWNVCQQPPAIS